jgi:hypothetical protein
MANKISSKILEIIDSLEKELQRLKIETYFNLPKEKRKSLYPEKSLRKTLRLLRKSIWQERYAKKI